MDSDDKISLPYLWKPRGYQLPLWKYMEGGGKRAVAIWHRRAGKDLTALNWMITQMVERVGLYWHVFPTYNQGKKVVWDGFTKDGRGFLDHIPINLVANRNDTEMKVELKTGSIYQVVGSDNVDRIVGSNPIGLVLSEYSLQDPRAWQMIRPILAENNGWAIFTFTPRGKNHGYDIMKMATSNSDWFCEILGADKTGCVSEEVIEGERKAGMPEELIKQEFYCSFNAPLVGTYFGHQMDKAEEEGRVARITYEPSIPVHTAWDLGVGDSTVIWFYQCVGTEIRIIDVFEASGEGLPYYAKQLQSLPYVYATN